MDPSAPHIPELQRDLLVVAGRLYGPRRHGHRRAAAGLALAAATAAAVVAFIVGAGSDPHANATNTTATQDELSAHFAAFRRAPDALPARYDPSGMFDPGTVHRLATPGGAALWVGRSRDWAGRHGGDRVCVMQLRTNNSSGGGCARVDQVLSDGFFTHGHPAPGDGAPGTTEVGALVPDGVKRVTFVFAGGNIVDVPVVDNGVSTTLPATPKTARFLDANGDPHVIDLGAHGLTRLLGRH
ncbi:MAG: hypothetical protein QOH11_834 [Solirubrobacteraceae bacterium]|nr:hypothetical protein [Solirubrobacteraceae bacterium]